MDKRGTELEGLEGYTRVKNNFSDIDYQDYRRAKSNISITKWENIDLWITNQKVNLDGFYNNHR